MLSDIKEINLGEIDLGSVHTGTPISMSIKDKLPSGVSLVSGQPETDLSGLHHAFLPQFGGYPDSTHTVFSGTRRGPADAHVGRLGCFVDC